MLNAISNIFCFKSLNAKYQLLQSDEEALMSGDEYENITLASMKNHNQTGKISKRSSFKSSNDLSSSIFKWTNYLQGWQQRYMVLKDGILFNYMNQFETEYGCRGSIVIKNCRIIEDKLDDCRFDIKVNGYVWYLKAKTVKEKQKWIDILDEQREDSSYGSQSSWQRHESMMSLNSATNSSITSTGSNGNTLNLKEKLTEIETNKSILCHQIENVTNQMIQHNLNFDLNDEAYAFKATITCILHDLSLCIELIQQKEEFSKNKINKKVEPRFRELGKEKKSGILLAGTDFDEGKHSSIEEEQFFDAINSNVDGQELEKEKRVQLFDSQTKLKHRFSDDIEKVVQEHLKYDLIDDLNSNTWELLCADGEMKIYRRELEENGIVLDPLKAVHTVKGITGHELCKYFWDPSVRLEWEGFLESSRVIEIISDDTLIFHQVQKRVWPTAQRDTCFWSHIRSVESENNEYPDWVVVNYSISHELAPAKEPRVRAWANVAMICSTIVSSTNRNAAITRENLTCKITYVSHVNPGGWVPANLLRAIYKREYPRFVKRFAEYVINKTANKPILF